MLSSWMSMVRWLRTPLPFLDDMAARHGTSFSLKLPRLPQPMVFFAEPAAIRDLWSGDPDVFRAGGGMSNIERLYANVPRLWGR